MQSKSKRGSMAVFMHIKMWINIRYFFMRNFFFWIGKRRPRGPEAKGVKKVNRMDMLWGRQRLFTEERREEGKWHYSLWSACLARQCGGTFPMKYVLCNSWVLWAPGTKSQRSPKYTHAGMRLSRDGCQRSRSCVPGGEKVMPAFFLCLGNCVQVFLWM